MARTVPSCSQQVKDKNFESNSQRDWSKNKSYGVVLSRSKIKISKAIHNLKGYGVRKTMVVLSRSKIKISKAIHNGGDVIGQETYVVLSRSKIKISKAIHN